MQKGCEWVGAVPKCYKSLLKSAYRASRSNPQSAGYFWRFYLIQKACDWVDAVPK